MHEEKLKQAVNTALDRLRRSTTLDHLYIVEVADDMYVICSEAFYPQLSLEYPYFNVVRIVYKDTRE